MIRLISLQGHNSRAYVLIIYLYMEINNKAYKKVFVGNSSKKLKLIKAHTRWVHTQNRPAQRGGHDV